MRRRGELQHVRRCLFNVVNFGPQTTKIGSEFRPTQNERFGRGTKGRCPLTISQLLQNSQCLLVHTPLVMVSHNIFKRDATQSAVMRQYVVYPSVTFRYRDHIYFENNFTAE